jgi:hypothetical protein
MRHRGKRLDRRADEHDHGSLGTELLDGRSLGRRGNRRRGRPRLPATTLPHRAAAGRAVTPTAATTAVGWRRLRRRLPNLRRFCRTAADARPGPDPVEQQTDRRHPHDSVGRESQE